MQDESVAGRMSVYSIGILEYRGEVKISKSVLKIISFRLVMSVHLEEEHAFRKTRIRISAAVSTVKECMLISRRHRKTKWKKS